ncbi:MAG: alginate lyase family protein, partial [Myxococcota bacterium]
PRSPVAWFDPALDEGTRLWKTLLHEFSYAVDLARASREAEDASYRERCLALMRSWAAEATIGRPGFARDSWNARAVATRLVNWALAAALLELDPATTDGAFVSRQLALHGLFLRENLEWDVRANHLLRDAVGLVFAHELCGCDAEAPALLRAQLAEQILADGCHYERTPHYHAIVLQDLLEVRALLGDETPAWLEESITRMAGFLDALLPEDGRLPLFGDTWHGDVEPRRLLAEAGPAAAPSREVVARASGLVVLRAGDAHVVVRAGAHGPDHQLGHAHADLLSFEASLGPARLVTDTGTCTYGAGPIRDRLRSTAAHNTVQLDDAELLETWGSFRSGRRGRASVRAQGTEAGVAWLHAGHDGWDFLPGRPRHERLLALSADRLLVLDAVLGSGRHRVRSALHLHPDAPAGLRLDWIPRGGHPRTAPAPLHEQFNETREMTEVAWEAEAGLPWVGGWGLAWGARPGEVWDLAYEDGRVRARTDALEIGWRVEGPPNVTIRGFEATLRSAN